MNANDATLTALASAQTGSMVADNTPNAPANGSFDLILQATAGSALGNSGTSYTLTISAIDLTAVTQGWPTLILHQALDTATGWQLTGVGPDYQCTLRTHRGDSVWAWSSSGLQAFVAGET